MIGHSGRGGQPVPGLKFYFCNRLYSDWSVLADFFDIPARDIARFPKGGEAREIWTWLEVRERLPELSGALRAIDRHDLADLAERDAGVVITRFDTHFGHNALRELYQEVIAGASRSDVDVRDVVRAGGSQPDLRFAAYRADRIVHEENSQDAVTSALSRGIGVVRLYLVGPAELRASAAAKVWEWVSGIECDGLVPGQVPDVRHLAIAMATTLSMLVTIRQGRNPGVPYGNPLTSHVGGLG